MRKWYFGTMFLVAFIGCLFFVYHASAATVTWDGGGSTNNWSEAANWSGDALPGSSDVATFDDTSTKDATVDGSFAGSVLGLAMNSGYTGTITLARTLTIGSSGLIEEDGTLNQSSYAVAVSGSITIGTGAWKQVTGGTAFSCGIDTNDRLFCWGLNTNGQLGDNTQTQHELPTEVSGGGTWKYVAAGDTHACAINSADELYCWGLNSSGQLGDNSTTERDAPTQVDGGGSWKKVDGGTSHTCAIKSDDKIYCWGINTNGQLGDNSTTQHLTPTPIDGTDTWSKVATGATQSCGIRLSDSALYCWGKNSNGQLGNASTSQSLVPVRESTNGTWQDVDTASTHTCGVTVAGGAYCWGAGTQGRLGTGNTTQQTSPTAIAVSGTWSDITTGTSHSCAVTTDGDAYCFGVGTNGQLGSGESFTLATLSFSTPQAVVKGKTWSTINGAGSHSCGITSDSSLYCFGLNTNGQLGNGESSATLTNTSVPNAVVGSLTFESIATGTTHSCGITTDSKLYCWGSSGTGDIGDGLMIQRLLPTEIVNSNGWDKVATGNFSSCAIDGTGILYCWGYNGNGNLGDGTTTDHSDPAVLAAPFNTATWTAVTTSVSAASFGGHACGIETDGSLYCWGTGSSGRLGDGGTSQRTSPVGVSGGGSWKQVSAGQTHTCAIKSDDHLYCWGSNSSGQLGDGGTTQHTTPTEVAGTTWKQVSAGNGNTCAIDVLDNLYCWGAAGKIGDNTNTQRLTPTEVAGGGTWTKVFSRDSNTCAIKSSGTVYCWGTGSNGQLGNGATSSVDLPTAISGGGTWSEIAVGYRQSCGLKSDGSAYCWGDNSIAQLGNGESGSYAFARETVAHDGGDFSAGATTLSATGSVRIYGGSFTAPSTSITASGDFLVGSQASFSANAGTVILNGTSQTIYGPVTFAGLTKTVSSADTLTFDTERIYTITGTLTLQGASAGKLSLRSSVDGERVLLDPQSTRTVQYLDVQDNANINSTTLTCDTGCDDSGNNTGWDFTAAASSSSGGGSTALKYVRDVVFTLTETDACSAKAQVNIRATNAKQYLLDDDQNFSSAVWQSFSGTASPSWTFATNQGVQTLYLLLRSNEGNVTSPYVATVTFSTCTQSDEDHQDDTESSPEDLPPLPPAISPFTGEVEEVENLPEGTVFRGKNYPTVYIIQNGIRRPFPDEQTFYTWFDAFSVVKTTTDATLAHYPIGLPVLPKPSVVMVKIQSASTVYTIEEGDTPTLRSIPSEEVARLFFGEHWADYIIDLPPTIFLKFTVDPNAWSSSDMHPSTDMLKRRMDLHEPL